MIRYFIELQYNGKNYHGWQLQPNASSVQQEINEKLSVLLRTDIFTTGAGRTDTGVSARYFVAHFDLDSKIKGDLKKLVYKLNSFLPNDIYVFRIIPVNNEAHARYDAISRTYRYYISTRKDVFNTDFTWQVYQELDIDLMNEGARKLMEYTDFASFSKSHTDVKNNNCTITESFWSIENHLLIYEISANRFLRNMVRAIVGTLVYLGRNKIDLNQFCEIIENKNRSLAGESAPANALFLEEIQYPFDF